MGPQCDIVKFESHGSGGSAFGSFLNKLGIYYVLSSNQYRASGNYTLFFNNLVFNENIKIIILREYISKTDGGQKLYSLIPAPRIMCLNQARDPISIIQAIINHINHV